MKMSQLRQKHRASQPITMATAYDYLGTSTPSTSTSVSLATPRQWWSTMMTLRSPSRSRRCSSTVAPWYMEPRRRFFLGTWLLGLRSPAPIRIIFFFFLFREVFQLLSFGNLPFMVGFTVTRTLITKLSPSLSSNVHLLLLLRQPPKLDLCSQSNFHFPKRKKPKSQNLSRHIRGNATLSKP